MTSSNLTFDGGQVKVRPNKAKFSNQYFYINANVSCSEFPQDSKYGISFLLRCVELQKSQVKKDVIIFLYILQMDFSNETFIWFVATVF